MRLNKFTQGTVSILLCFTLVFAVVGVSAPKTYAKSLSSLKSEYSEIKDKVKESEDKVSELEKQQAKQEEVISALNIQISRLNDELANVQSQKGIISDDINETNARIEKINDEIEDLNRQIAQKEVEIDETVEAFCERMRANYMAGKTSAIEILSASSSFASFLNRLEMFKRVTESDQSLVNQLNDEIASIEKMQKSLEEKKTGLETEKQTLVNKKADLQSTENALSATQAEIIEKSKEVNDKLAALNYQTKTLELSIDEYNRQMDKLEAEITAYIKQNSSVGNINASGNINAGHANSNISYAGWQWPVPYSDSYISSPYGYRVQPLTGYYKFHCGIDITASAAYGKKLVATKAGTVIYTGYQQNGYGNYLIIDHGNGYTSLYGHCSSLAVSQGQKVSQGQVVAYIGESGFATGPHVHFEIRYNGETQNPSNFVSK